MVPWRVPIASLVARLTPKLQHLFLLGAVAYLVIGSFGPVMNNVDLGWHVAQGRWMVQHGAVYRTDQLSYANAGRPVIDEYPVFQVILYAAWKLGWWGPCALTAMAYAALVIPLASAAWRLESAHGAVFTLAVGLMLLCLASAPMLRPHVATYLGVVLLGLFLLRHREAADWKIFWPAALGQGVWTNCHSGFVIGPAMVALFGAEVTLRGWISSRAFPHRTALTWLGAFALLFAACLLNPFGASRFGPPFQQQQLESIRAYVGEMQPLPAPLVRLYGVVTLACGAGILILVSRTRTAADSLVAGSRRTRATLPISFLLLAALFLWEALSAKKAWPVFGLFAPLIVLGIARVKTPDDRPWRGLAACALSFFTAAAMAVALQIDWSQANVAWREIARSHTELSVDAAAWMKSHGITGRIFHRCEDGGFLQMEGFDHGETFADTGFGKYDERFIHEVGLVNERPALLPRFLSVYRPDFVVCSNFCYQWPYYLRNSGFVLVHYSLNSSVWQKPSHASVLPSSPGFFGAENVLEQRLVPAAGLPQVGNSEVEKIVDTDLAQNGPPSAPQLGRDLLMLNSLGCGDFAFRQLTGLPAADHHAAWYWEAARILCFDEPRLPGEQRAALMREAESLPDATTTTAEFRAYVKEGLGDTDGALAILRGLAPDHLGNWSAELLLKIELERNDPAALALARRTDCFDLRNGRHWQYLAQAEERFGSIWAARTAWQKAVFYYPDDDTLMNKARDFAQQHDDAELRQKIAEAGALPPRP